MQWITSNLAILLAAGLGGVAWFCADRVLYFLLQKFNLVSWFHGVMIEVNKQVEDIKKKTPESGKLLEAQIIAELDAGKAEMLK